MAAVRIVSMRLQAVFDRRDQFLWCNGRFKSSDNPAVAADQELCEIPLDRAVRIGFPVFCFQHHFECLGFQAGPDPVKSRMTRQILINGIGIRTADFDF